MTKYVRGFFRCEDDETSNIVMDILLGNDRRVLNHVPLFGFWGKLRSNQLWPFIFHNKQIDFGEQFDADDSSDARLRIDERYADFDLCDRIIAVGERFTLTYHRDDWHLRLEKITDITAL